MHHSSTKGQPAVPGRSCGSLALEPARRDQGRLRGDAKTGSPKQRTIAEGDGAHRHADDPRCRHRQPAGRLESVHQRGPGHRRRRIPTSRRRPAARAQRARAGHALRELLDIFRAARLADPYSPTAPTLIARRFDEDRQIPEARVREDARGRALLAARAARRQADREAARPQARAVRHLVRRLHAARRLHRSAARRDRAQEYPTRRRVQEGHPASARRSSASRHGDGGVPRRTTSSSTRRAAPATRWAPAAAATRRTCARASSKDGMNYKGYNIAVHEMGHNVEQTFSLNEIDHTLLQGVPNTAFTEALAFVFQATRPRAARAAPSPTRKRGRSRRSTISGGPARSPASRWSTWACGTGCTTIPTPRRRSCARRRVADRQATSGTSTTRRSSGKKDVDAARRSIRT